MEQQQEQNRTEPATPFKLEEARKKGQVAKSMDFNSFVIAWAFLLGALIAGAGIWRDLTQTSAAIIASAASPAGDLTAYTGWIRSFMFWTLAMVLPVAVVAMIFGVLGNLVQTGPVLSSEPLKPKLERINPVAGFKRIFNKRMLFEAFKSVLKLVFFVAIIVFFFVELWPHLAELATPDPNGQGASLADWGIALLFRLALALALIGLLDLVYVRWTYARQMRMSRRELKDEVKRREGDPQIRAKLRELQRERLKQIQSVSRVDEADVLITNPTHLAVALKYVHTEMAAPQVIAKGAEAWADQMRSTCAQRGIPVVRRARLARRLYRRTQVGQAVPPETFLEVARIYSTLESKRRKAVKLEVRP